MQNIQRIYKGEENGKQRIFSGMQSQDCRLCE